MGGNIGLTIPAEAAAASAERAKTVDFYADMTDEERATEGLPPREEPKEEPKPAGESEPGGETEDEQEPIDTDVDTDRLLDEIEGLREDLGEVLGKPNAAPLEEVEDHFLAAALEHEDPVIRGLAERIQNAEKRLVANETEARDTRVERQIAKDSADFDAVQGNYAIGGKPMTDAQVERVEQYILKNPAVGSRLSIEEVTRVVFPDAVRVGSRSTAAKGPGGAASVKGPPVATIVDEGSSGGSPDSNWKPRPNETIESAVAEAGRRLFGVKR